MYVLTGNGLGGGPQDLRYAYVSNSYVGQDQYTDSVFKALQAQLNRLVDGAVVMANAQHNAAAARAALKFRLAIVDGKIGSSTVNTYKFVAQGLTGVVNMPVPFAAATKETVARNAENIARLLQALSDRNGFPPASVSLPGMPSAPSAASQGPATTYQTTQPLPPDVLLKLQQSAANMPPDDFDLVSNQEASIFKSSGSSSNKWIWIGAGGVVVAIIAYFALRKSRG